jgi:hypothetical protein
LEKLANTDGGGWGKFTNSTAEWIREPTTISRGRPLGGLLGSVLIFLVVGEPSPLPALQSKFFLLLPSVLLKEGDLAFSGVPTFTLSSSLAGKEKEEHQCQQQMWGLKLYQLIFVK